MNDFTFDFEDFTSQMMRKAYQNFRNTDLETQELEYYITVHKDKFNNILNTLSEEDKHFTKDYIDKQLIIKSNANEGIYRAGYKDCVNLLRVIGVLS